MILSFPFRRKASRAMPAYSRTVLNLPDVYDDEALKRIHPALTFLKVVDKRSGYRTKQMLVAPIMEGDTLLGVCFRSLTTKVMSPLVTFEVDGVNELCKTLATADTSEGQRKLGGSAQRKPQSTTRWLQKGF